MTPNSIPKLLLPVGVITFALVIAVVLISTKPEANKRPQGAIAAIVDVAPIGFGDFPVHISAMGEVVAAREIDLVSQVSGEIIEVSENFVPGGLVAAHETLLQIDPKDYELELAKQQAAYDIEQGQQEKVRKELELLGRPTSKKNEYLVLRGPQLAQAKADLSKTQLNLQRTIIKAPYNLMVVERHVNLGEKVSAQQNLATLVGTDEYWVEASVPVAQLPWIETGDLGNNVEVKLNGGRGGLRNGRVLRVVARLGETSRLLPVIIQIDDPLLLKDSTAETINQPVLLGDYVLLSITGKTLQGVYRTPHHYVRDGNIIWAARDQKMVFIPLEILHKDRSYVYFKANLQKNERIVTSNVATPINGMKIEISNRSVDAESGAVETLAQASRKSPVSNSQHE